MTRFMGAVGALAVAVLASGCGSYVLPPQSTSNGVTTTLGAPEVGPGMQYMFLPGASRNDTGRQLRSVNIRVPLYNKDGVKVAEALAFSSDLAPGETWAWKAFINPPVPIVHLGQIGQPKADGLVQR